MSGITSPLSTRELGAALRRWAADGIGVVRVLDRHGFGTVESGQMLARHADGDVAGRVLLGALDDVALPLALGALSTPSSLEAHVTEAAAVEAGLACAGGARLLGHPLPAALAEALGAALANGHPAALASTGDGARQLVLAGVDLSERHGGLDSETAERAVTDRAVALLRRGATSTERITKDDVDVLLDLWVPVPTVWVVGSGAIGEALLAQAELLGWAGEQVTELDAASSAVARFTDADVLVLLDHAPRFDSILIDGIRRGHGFLGVLGSRRTQQVRRNRLVAAGLSEAELAVLRGPVGLDLGSRTPAETAVSIVAEVIAARGGRAGAALAGTEGRISS